MCARVTHVAHYELRTTDWCTSNFRPQTGVPVTTDYRLISGVGNGCWSVGVGVGVGVSVGVGAVDEMREERKSHHCASRCALCIAHLLRSLREAMCSCEAVVHDVHLVTCHRVTNQEPHVMSLAHLLPFAFTATGSELVL
jgi:hypothetical protein